MPTLYKWSIPGAILLSVAGVSGACPGPVGDSFCQTLTSSFGRCEPGQWMCAGTTVSCGCDFRSPVGATVRPPPVTVASSRSSVAPPTQGSTVSVSTAVGTSSSRTTTSTLVDTTVSPTTTTMVTESKRPDAGLCGAGPSRPLFIWAEWPDLEGKAAWSAYYGKVLGFIAKNCGNFRVTRLIMRVMEPFTQGLWDISDASSFYVDFLSKLPSNVELRIYPYLLDAKAQGFWSTYSGKATPLDGVFKYARDWNSWLAAKGAGIRIGGIVVDGEERKGFDRELSSLGTYKSTYGVAIFGVAIGFDTVGSVAQYMATDEFYLEMYDFYVVSAPKLTLVQTSPSDSPNGFLANLDKQTLAGFASKYSDPRFQFMWSVQAKSSSNCIYPLGSGCGTSDDFGHFSAQDFGTFLDLAQARYPLMAGRSHGIFQFSFVPPSWL